MKPTQQPPTGEHFVMCTPNAIEANPKLEGYIARAHWQGLRQAIELCGGAVSTLPSMLEPMSSIYTRDASHIFFSKDGRRQHVVPAEQGKTHMSQVSALNYFLPEIAGGSSVMDGYLEGGNAVADRQRNILFVGMSNKHWMEMERFYAKHILDFLEDTEFVEELEEDRGDPNPRVRRYDYAQRANRGLQGLRDRLAAGKDEIVPGRDAPRVVPLSVPDSVVDARFNVNTLFSKVDVSGIPAGEADEFYHLDGLLNVLPSGQAVVCRSKFPAVGRNQLDHYIGRDNMLEVTPDEARKGATNLITVGKHIITPYASPAMKKTFASYGYDVIDPPAMGLPDGAWMFCPMGSVRCATLKVTPDMGFPEPAVAAGRGK